MTAGWDQGAAEFARWAQQIWQPLAVPLVEAARLSPGDRVFDACCGTGASALLAAQAVGADGQVDAVDASAGMIDQAKSAAVPEQLDFRVADALTWPGTGYHAVLCGFGIFFLGDQSAALASLADRLAPGGRIALSVWQGRPFDALTRLVLAACAAEGAGAAGPSAEAKNIGELNSPSKLTDFLRDAGLQEVAVVAVRHRVPLTVDSAWSFVHSSLLRSALPADPAAVARVKARLAGSLDGVELQADALIGSARR